MADLDIEETNRLRAALGMPLLPTSNGSSNLEFKSSVAAADDAEEEDLGSTLESRAAAAGDNWKKLQQAEAEKKQREARRAALKKERDAALRFAKLEGKGLGDADEGDLDTRSWLLSSNKRQKKIAKERARQLQKELEERENQAQYTESDLAGKKVAHELGEFDEEGEHILTLKDAAIDAESEDDELENAELREKEKLNERLKLKTKRTVYDPNAEEEGGEKSVLAQYDEEIQGKKKKHFTLDGFGRTQEGSNGTDDAPSGPRGLQFSLDIAGEDRPRSDYMDISEIKIKKPKKKKDKSKRQRPVDEDDDDLFAATVQPAAPPAEPLDAMQVDGAQQEGGLKRKREDVSFIDDDDLQASLAAQRMAALKKRKRARPEDLARQLREEASATPGPADEMDVEEEEEEGGLVIDETSEFVSNLQKPKAPAARRASPSRPIKREPSAGGDADATMRNASDSEDDAEDEPARVKPDPSPEPQGPHTATGLAEEETFNNAGIGATMGMLKQRGLVKVQDGSELNAAHSRQAQFIKHKERLEKEWERVAQEKRKHDRDNGLFDRMSRKQQEEYAQAENRRRDQKVSEQLAEIFKFEYKPNVELKYIDEFGRRMDSREAFKQMSHQFHGKGSGKQKTEKRLKKIEEEKAREARSNLSTSQIGLNSAAGTQAKKQRAAGVRLQ